MKYNIYSVFANQARLKLITCLGNGEKNVTELIGNCGLSQSAVSQHLEKLRMAKFVSTRRDGKEIFYKLNFKKSAPEFFMADLTRSFDSSTALSGSPTIVKLGKPCSATSTSTSTKVALSPTVVPEVTFESIINTNTNIHGFEDVKI